MSIVSKRPWSAGEHGSGKVYDASGYCILGASHANLAHIVKCVNTHEQSLEAMRAALATIDLSCPVGKQAVAAVLLQAAIAAAEA